MKRISTHSLDLVLAALREYEKGLFSGERTFQDEVPLATISRLKAIRYSLSKQDKWGRSDTSLP